MSITWSFTQVRYGDLTVKHLWSWLSWRETIVVVYPRLQGDHKPVIYLFYVHQPWTNIQVNTRKCRYIYYIANNANTFASKLYVRVPRPLRWGLPLNSAGRGFKEQSIMGLRNPGINPNLDATFKKVHLDQKRIRIQRCRDQTVAPRPSPCRKWPVARLQGTSCSMTWTASGPAVNQFLHLEISIFKYILWS